MLQVGAVVDPIFFVLDVMLLIINLIIIIFWGEKWGPIMPLIFCVCMLQLNALFVMLPFELCKWGAPFTSLTHVVMLLSSNTFAERIF